MLDWLRSTIGKKPDHPMRDVAAAQKLLRELPADNGKALEEISSWLDTVAATEGFDPSERAGVVKLLDETGQVRERAELMIFLRGGTHKDFERLRRWQLVVDFWECVAGAYGVCLKEAPPGEKTGSPEQAARALLAARTLRALSNEAKQLQFRYLPVPLTIWRGLSDVYNLSEQNGVAEVSQKVYAGDAVASTPRQEFLRALMLDLSRPESARPEHIEIASRVIARLSAGFAFSAKPEAGCNLCFDLAQPARPAHCPPGQVARESMRYFGAGRVPGAIREIIDRHTAHADEPERRFGDEFSIGDKLIVLKHLLVCWDEAPPRQVEPMVKINSPIKLARGFVGATGLATLVEFSGMAEMTGDQLIRMKEQTGLGLEERKVDVPTVEWIERDAGKWGIGVDIPRQDESWASIGTLCTFQPAGRHVWWLGVIRRLYRDVQDREHAGVEILAKKPMSVWLRGLGEGAERADNWATSSGSFQFTYANALILGEGATSEAGHDLIVARDSFVRPGILFEVMMGEKPPQVKFEELLERGEDFDRVRVSWLGAEMGVSRASTPPAPRRLPHENACGETPIPGS